MWDKLKAHHATIADQRIEDMLDASRAADFAVSVGDMHFDYAKTQIGAAYRAAQP